MRDQPRLSESGSWYLYHPDLERFSVCFLPTSRSTFTKLLDLLRHIEYEFGQFGPADEAYYGYFNPAMLNEAAGAINSTITFGYPAAPGFLFATLPAYNTSDSGISSGELQSDANTTGSSTSSTSSSSQDTGVAM